MGRKGLQNILDSTIILILCREIKRTWFKVLIFISVEHLIQTFPLNHYVRFDFIDIKKPESTKTTFRKPEQREFSTQNNLGTPVTHEPENETTKIKKIQKNGILIIWKYFGIWNPFTLNQKCESRSYFRSLANP